MHHNTSDNSNSQNQDIPTDTLINNANNAAFNTETNTTNNLGSIYVYILKRCVKRYYLNDLTFKYLIGFRKREQKRRKPK